MKRWVIIPVAILSLALVSAAGYLGFYSSQEQAGGTPQAPPTVAVTTCDIQQSVTAPGNLVNRREVTLEMPAIGRLAEVLAQPGNRVQAGQVLARLADPETFSAAVASAKLDLEKAKQELAYLSDHAALEAANALKAVAEAEKAQRDAAYRYQTLTSPLPDDQVEAAQEKVREAHAGLEEAKKKLAAASQERNGDIQAIADLHKTVKEAEIAYDSAEADLESLLGGVDEITLRRAEAELAVANAELDEARRKYALIQDGPDPLQVELAEAKVADAEARLAEAEKDLADVELRAPFDGVVLEVKAQAGQSLPEGEAVLSLVDPQAVEVEATVIEEDLPSVQVGQAAQVFFDALPEAEAAGRVARIAPKRAPGDRPLYYVYISLEELPNGLVSGMTADASIIIAEKKGVLCLPRSVVRASAGDTAVVKVWTGGNEERRTMQVGLRGDTDVEVVSGLKEGDLVVGG